MTLISYTGPYSVGTVDVEVLVSELSSPATSAVPDPTVSTVAYRVFYPCEKPHRGGKYVHWVPDPQREYVAAYARFLGASPRMSNWLSFLPLLYHTKIPAYRTAQLLQPSTKNKKWPVVVFSHGLGGTRNAYSHILGSLASHGVVVIAPEHRDGSCPISTIQGGNSVEYKHLPHTKAKGVLDEREQQLKVRLWELGLVYDALLKMEDGNPIQNFRKDDSAFDMSVFRNTLNVYEPGSITWAGHSFGAATSVQFVKSVFYRPPQNERSYHPLYVTAPDSQLSKQITPRSSLDLLDIWMLPILSDTTAWLRNKPLPCYTDPTIGGSNVLSILSEAFFKWQANFVEMKRIVSDDPTGEKRTTQGQKQPHIFYPATSAHLSQSDFGVLFPRLVKIGLKALEPERAIRLNVRAMLEVMRIAGAEVANTSDVDMELAGNHFDKAKQSSIHDTGFGAGQDSGILKTDGSVRGWISLSVKAEDESVGEGKNAKSSVANGPSDMVN